MTDYLRTCPSCGTVNDQEPYDIGDGPEFACPNCEWCWGANGQDLTDGPIKAMYDEVRGLTGRSGYDGHS